MKKLNEKGISVIEVILTFALIMVIISGILTVIMNYKQKAQAELKRLELVNYKDTLTKEIQTDIIDRGIYEINQGGLCLEQADLYNSCINIVFKDGIEKILAVSKLDDSNLENLEKLLNNKYIKYGDTKYPIEDKIASKIPEGRSIKDFQNIYINGDSILTSDSVILDSGLTTKIYSIDIYMEHIDYDDDFGIHIVATDNDTLTTNMITNEFAYTGSPALYTVPANGTYKFELWGASGGDKDDYTGGLGSYVSGYTYLNKGTTLYLYVGGAGIEKTILGGYNGGSSINSSFSKYGSPGGGATDVRLVGGNWDSFESLKSRIIVAAGGGGANNHNTVAATELKLYGAGNGGAGGGTEGYAGEAVNYKATEGFSSNDQYYVGDKATQTAGGNTLEYDSNNSLKSTTRTGGFGKSLDTQRESGAGGGWFTGGNGSHAGAGGGSSYISGHEGCRAISEAATETNIQMKSNSEYAGYYFDNTTMIDGNGYSWSSVKGGFTQMPTYTGKTNDVGNKGNGFIKITYLGI